MSEVSTTTKQQQRKVNVRDKEGKESKDLLFTVLEERVKNLEKREIEMKTIIDRELDHALAKDEITREMSGVLANLKELTDGLIADKKEKEQRIDCMNVVISQLMESNKELTERVTLLESREMLRKEEKIVKIVKKKEQVAKPMGKARKPKTKAPPSYEYYGWTGKDLSALLSCVLSGGAFSAVVQFIDLPERPKDIQEFITQTLDEKDEKDEAEAPKSAIVKLLIGLKNAVDKHFDKPEKGISGFSYTVVRRINGLYKTAQKENNTDLENFANRLVKIGAAQRECLRNGPPIENPTGVAQNTNGLSLCSPVNIKQVKVTPLRLKNRTTPVNGGNSIHIHTKDKEPRDDHHHDETSKEDDEHHHDEDEEEEHHDEEEEEEHHDEEDEEEHHDEEDEEEHHDDDEEEEPHEDDEDDEEPHEEDDEMLDMTKSFREMCVDEWKGDWNKCQEHPSLFGMETNARGVTRIYACLSGDVNTDRKAVLATVAHGALAYATLANQPLGELEL